jgi:iron complex transport system substrate-binding protein
MELMALLLARPRRKTRKTRQAATAVAALLSLGLVVSGCSSSDDDGAASSSDAQDGTRTVTDSEGTQVEVPAHPERAATLHFAATEALLDLGVAPVVQGSGNLKSLLPADDYEKVKDVPQLDQSDTDIEKIAQAKPDIILAADMVDKQTVEQLRDIAPVYVYTHAKDRSNWEGRGDQIADAMNLGDKLDDVKKELKDRQQEIADKYKGTLEGFRGALFGGWKENSFTVIGPESMPGRILAPAGLQWDATTTDMTKGIDGQELSQSVENLPSTLKDADAVFYGTDLFGKPAVDTGSVLELQAYKDLPAVKAGKSFPIGKQTIAGYMDAFNALDFLEDALKKLEQDK